MKRTAPLRAICLCFFLWAAFQAWGQERFSIELLRGAQVDGSNSPEVQQQEMQTWRLLPDAPSSVQASNQALKFHTLVNETSLGQLRETELGHFTPGSRPGRLAARYQVSFIQERPSPFVAKYLSPSAGELHPRYHLSSSNSLVGRVSYAVTRIFITRDDYGKAKLNTPYFLGLLASVAAHSASHTYLARSTLATFNSFGSTVGSDAGMNVFHEFSPGIRQIVKGHTPKFVSRVEERFRASLFERLRSSKMKIDH